MADAFPTQPLLIVAGSTAGSKRMTYDPHWRATSKDKRLHDFQRPR
ncbi:hypothetical protein U0E10_09685 [Burkholderia ubonensis]|nr:hypothetical protein [Burkholderia ubonensis]MDY7788183.1 hypothetical protein [Burkholderia ubonensis]